MKYILEGPDGTGKTWYAKYELSTLCYYHNRLKPKGYKDVIRETGNDILLLSEKTEGEVVLDRSFIISEYVYSRVLDRKRYVTEDLLLGFIRDCYERRTRIMVFLYKDPDKTSVRTLSEKEKDSLLPIKELNDFYADLFTEKEKNYSNISILYTEDLLKQGGKHEDSVDRPGI